MDLCTRGLGLQRAGFLAYGFYFRPIVKRQPRSVECTAKSSMARRRRAPAITLAVQAAIALHTPRLPIRQGRVQLHAAPPVDLAQSRYRSLEIFDGDALGSVRALRSVFDERFAAPRELEPGEEPCNEYTRLA